MKKGQKFIVLFGLMFLVMVYLLAGCTGVNQTATKSENQTTDTQSQGEDTEVFHNKKKEIETNRTMKKDEKDFCTGMHISCKQDSACGNGGVLYSTLKISGDALGEEEVYSVKDIEQLLQSSFTNEQLYTQLLPISMNYAMDGKKQETFQGMSLVNFLKLCGVDVSTGIYAVCYGIDQTEAAAIVNLTEVTGEDAIIAFAKANTPLCAVAGSNCCCATGDCTGTCGCGNDSTCTVVDGVSGPLCLIVKQGNDAVMVQSLSKLTLSSQQQPQEQEYNFHNRSPYAESSDKTFTIEVYKKNAEYLGVVNSLVLMTSQMEQLAKDNPEAVVGNYYGTIGDSESMEYMGIGGWLDYFEGLDLYWLLTEQMGIDKNASGSATLYGRDGEEYSTVEDIQYFLRNKNASDYSVMTADGDCITGAYPMIAYSKNGYPLLPEHDHEAEGYIAYNKMSTNLETMGVQTEIGVIKNHSGPFIACLGNSKGFYGGYEVETGGDCVKMKIVIE